MVKRGRPRHIKKYMWEKGILGDVKEFLLISFRGIMVLWLLLNMSPSLLDIHIERFIHET